MVLLLLSLCEFVMNSLAVTMTSVLKSLICRVYASNNDNSNVLLLYVTRSTYSIPHITHTHTHTDPHRFDILHKQDQEAQRKKFWWVYEQETKHRQEQLQKKLLTYAREHALQQIKAKEEKAAPSEQDRDVVKGSTKNAVEDDKNTHTHTHIHTHTQTEDPHGVLQFWDYSAKTPFMFHPEE